MQCKLADSKTSSHNTRVKAAWLSRACARKQVVLRRTNGNSSPSVCYCCRALVRVMRRDLLLHLHPPPSPKMATAFFWSCYAPHFASGVPFGLKKQTFFSICSAIFNEKTLWILTVPWMNCRLNAYSEVLFWRSSEIYQSFNIQVEPVMTLTFDIGIQKVINSK